MQSVPVLILVLQAWVTGVSPLLIAPDDPALTFSGRALT